MKNYTNPTSFRHSRPFDFISFGSLIGAFLLSLIALPGSAQSSGLSSGSEVITTDAYTQDVWKKTDDYAATLNSELSITEVNLQDQSLTVQQKALLWGYQRMLHYMQNDMVLKAPVENIASDNFKKVLQEAPTDPKLINMEVHEFNAKFNSLVGMLLK